MNKFAIIEKRIIMRVGNKLQAERWKEDFEMLFPENKYVIEKIEE